MRTNSNPPSTQSQQLSGNRTTSNPPSTQNSTASASQKAKSPGQPQKIMITGDDILIEYVTRLMKMFSQGKIQEEQLALDQQSKIEKFITHYVWYAQDKNGKGKQQ